METMQAMIVMNNGVRKYGTIIDMSDSERIKFIPGAEALKDESLLSGLIEHIPVANIYSIDPFMK